MEENKEENKIETTVEESGVVAENDAKLNDELLPAEIDTLPLEKETQKIIRDIISAKSTDELKTVTDLFAINQAKKNALRVAKLNNLLDAVNDQAIERFEKRPGEISNMELIAYMKTVQDQIDKSYKSIETIDTKPMIQVQNNEVNISITDSLTRDQKENVVRAVKELLKQTTQEPIIDVVEEPITDVIENEEVIDAVVVETAEENKNV